MQLAVSMLVYIDIASYENMQALGGRVSKGVFGVG
jgi:hypothetical protein